MSNSKRKELENTGRGAVGKTAVAGLKDRASNQARAKVAERADAETLQGFAVERADAFATTVHTDDSKAYASLPFDRDTVKHPVSEHVKGMARTNGIESFRAMLKRAHKGAFHKISPKHLDRHAREFAAKRNMRESDTLAQMRDVVARTIGRGLRYTDLIADNGLASGARSQSQRQRQRFRRRAFQVNVGVQLRSVLHRRLLGADRASRTHSAW